MELLQSSLGGLWPVLALWLSRSLGLARGTGVEERMNSKTLRKQMSFEED